MRLAYNGRLVFALSFS